MAFAHDTTLASPPLTLLVVDDDARLRGLLKEYMVRAGYQVVEAEHAEAAWEQLQTHPEIAAVILDIMMPGESGLALTARLKEAFPLMPVLLLTAMDTGKDRIQGLAQGADDYLVKPFEPEELLLRIRNMCRPFSREAQGAAQVAAQTAFGPFVFFPHTGELVREAQGEEQRIVLTSTERTVLALLAESVGQTVSRDAIAGALHGISARSVDVQMTRLRQKLDDTGAAPRYIKTIRGMGYMLCV